MSLGRQLKFSDSITPTSLKPAVVLVALVNWIKEDVERRKANISSW